MGVIGRAVGGLILALIAAMAATAVAARAARDRLVRRDHPDADEVDLVAIFEPLAFRSTAARFRGGTLECWFGGGVVDLRGATLDPAGATLRVRAMFGGGQVVVPDDWRVETRVVGLGGAGDARPKREHATDAPLLRIEGLAFFGGFGVSSSLPEEGESWMGTSAAEAPRAPGQRVMAPAEAPPSASAVG